jgi:hypothetical protein
MHSSLGAHRSAQVRTLSALLVALELVVAASALERLRLYQHEYGLTELRLYASGVVLWLAVVFVWLCATTLRGRGRFAIGALVLGFAATAGLNVVNPDGLIARTNVTRPHVDVRYLGTLSDDAVPELLQRLPSLPPRLRRVLAQELVVRSEAGGGLLAWNASRARARGLLADRRSEQLRFARSGG